jgi:peptidoglycan/LPS O-acetylase OafA/YrhL
MVPGFRGDSPDISVGRILFHFLYAIPLTSYQWLNPVYWTLVYEFIFYVLVGLLFVPLMKVNAIWTSILAILIGGTIFSNGNIINYRVFEFLLGVLAMRNVVRRDPPVLNLILCGVSTAGILWFGNVLSAIGATFSAVAMVLFVNRRPGPILLWLGAISYSFYLVHVPIGGRVVNLGKRLGHGEVYDCLVMAAALVVSLAFAAVFFYFIEKPAIRLSRKISIERSMREFSTNDHC